MRIIDGGTIFTGQKGTDHQSCAFPGICILPDGRWICGFRAAPVKEGTKGQHALITWSDDEGKSWSKPISPFIPPAICGKPGLFRGAYMTALGGRRVLVSIMWVDYSEPELAFFNQETEGLLDTRIFFSISEDNGETWLQPVLMDTTPFNVPTPLTGPVLCLPGVELACQFELNKHYYDTTVWRHSSVIMFSRDGGLTWSEYVVTSKHPENLIFYWDQRPGILSDGRILNLFWTYDNKNAVYLNIHASESLDNGHTWSSMWDTGVPGQPAQPVSLPDGKIAMVYIDRTGSPAVKIRTSEDGGRTWPEHTGLLIYSTDLVTQTWNKNTMQDAWSEMGKFSVGLPATACLKNGDILVVYYEGPYTDITGIQWVRLRAG